MQPLPYARLRLLLHQRQPHGDLRQRRVRQAGRVRLQGRMVSSFAQVSLPQKSLK